YADRMLSGSVLFPGLDPVLAELAESRRLLVATSKPGRFAVPILEALGIAERFEAILAPSDDVHRESKRATIARALELAGTERAVMVGDTKYDAAGAAGNGIP